MENKISCYHPGEGTLPLEQPDLLTATKSNTPNKAKEHLVVPACFSWMHKRGNSLNLQAVLWKVSQSIMHVRHRSTGHQKQQQMPDSHLVARRVIRPSHRNSWKNIGPYRNAAFSFCLVPPHSLFLSPSIFYRRVLQYTCLYRHLLMWRCMKPTVLTHGLKEQKYLMTHIFFFTTDIRT